MPFVEPSEQNEDSLRFGLALKEAREAKGLTQTQVAVKLGLTQGRISQIEGGKVDVDNTIFRLCDFLDTPPPRSAFSDDDEYEWFQAGRKIRSASKELFAIQLSLARALAARPGTNSAEGPKKT